MKSHCHILQVCDKSVPDIKAARKIMFKFSLDIAISILKRYLKNNVSFSTMKQKKQALYSLIELVNFNLIFEITTNWKYCIFIEEDCQKEINLTLFSLLQ
jgi:hypothetical protein